MAATARGRSRDEPQALDLAQPPVELVPLTKMRLAIRSPRKPIDLAHTALVVDWDSAEHREAPIGAFHNPPGPSSLGTRGGAPPAPELAHRSHDAHIRDVQIALSDLELGVPEEHLDLPDVEAVFKPP